MKITYAMAGALIGMLPLLYGFRVHLGLSFYDGLPAYLISAPAGAFAALLLRHEIQKAFGPIIP